MIIPIRCFSCGTVIAHKWDEFNNKLAEGTSVEQALDDVGLERYCCRRMYAVSYTHLTLPTICSV